MANAGCINAYDCSWNLIRTLEQLQSSNIGVWVQYTAPNPLDDKKIDYIKYTDKCWNTCCLTWENEILIYATNWVIKNLTLTNDDTNEAVVVKWNDIFWSNRAKTVVRYKTGSAPISPTDWTLAVEETTKNQYSTNWFSVTGLSDSTTYYFSVFALDIDGTMIDVQSSSITTDFWWKPSANTLARYKLGTNANDFSWNNRNLNNSGVTFTTLNGVPCAYFNNSWYLYRSQSLFTWNPTFTFNIWMRRSATTTKAQNIVSIWAKESTNSFIMWMYDNTNILYTWWWTNDRNTWYTPPLNTWINLWVSYNKDNKTIKVYINWVQVFTSTLSWFTIPSSNTYLWTWVDWSSNVSKLNWYLSEAIFESVEWTANDFLKHYNHTKSDYGY